MPDAAPDRQIVIVSAPCQHGLTYTGTYSLPLGTEENLSSAARAAFLKQYTTGDALRIHGELTFGPLDVNITQHTSFS